MIIEQLTSLNKESMCHKCQKLEKTETTWPMVILIFKPYHTGKRQQIVGLVDQKSIFGERDEFAHFNTCTFAHFENKWNLAPWFKKTQLNLKFA